MFNTESHLGRNAAVIIAWIVMSCATLTVFTWLVPWVQRKWRLRTQRTRTRPKSPEAADVAYTPSQGEKGKETSPA